MKRFFNCILLSGMILTLPGCRTDCTMIRLPVRLSKLNPVYTESARKAHIEGRVVLKLLVGGQGDVIDIEVVRGLPMGLTEAAINAARDLKFQPAVRVCDGKPVECYYTLTILFEIERPSEML